MGSRVANQRRYWDKLAHTYSQRYCLNSQSGQVKIRRKAKMLVAGAGVAAKAEVLEIGCGTGVFTRVLADTKATITALDISPAMLRAALSIYTPNTCYMLGDIHKTSIGDNWFDAVIGCYILQYLDLTIAIPEIKRVLKPGGRVAFIDINTLNPLAFAKTKLPFVKKRMGISKEAVSFTPWGLCKWFEGYGFTDIKVTPFEFGGKLNFLESVPVIRQFGGSLLITARKP